MILRHITIKELNSFTESTEFKTSDVLPITRIRSYSQSLNPSALPDDVALILAINENNEIVGYIGILPCSLYFKNEKIKIYSNTGWWVHPQKGRKAAMTLFYAMLELYGSRLFFADLTPHTSIILQKIGLFILPEITPGFKYYFKIPIASLLLKKTPAFKKVKAIIMGVERIVNFPFTLCLKWFKGINNKYECIELNRLDSDVERFINSRTLYEPILRNTVDLNWAIANPWLRESAGHLDVEASKYYFSTLAHIKKYFCYKVLNNNNLIGVFILFNRDGDYKVPFFLAKPESESVVIEKLKSILFKLQASSFITWQKPINEYFKKNRKGILFQKELLKQEAWSIELQQYFELLKMQDGDGDMIFT